MSKKVILLAIISLFGMDISAQSIDKLLYVEVEYNRDNEPEFFVVNRTLFPYTVFLNFTFLQNALYPSPNPYPKTIKPGKKKVLTLKKRGIVNNGGQRVIRFNYSWTYLKGCTDANVDEDIEYSLPIKTSKNTKVKEYSYLGEVLDKEAPKNFYSVGFSSEPLDTIFASRKGIVSDIVDKYETQRGTKFYSSEQNLIRILHEDCTFGTYTNIRKGSFLVEEGQEVEVGDPIAFVSSSENPENTDFNFSLVHVNPNFEKEDNYWSYAIPKFRVEKGKFVQLVDGEEYRSVLPDDIITQEMSRRERRRWRKKNN
jgi:hypothetical protein